jgi:subtilisin family serine protease
MQTTMKTSSPLCAGFGAGRARRNFVVGAVAAAAALACPAAFAQAGASGAEAFSVAPGRILVMPRAGMSEQKLGALLRENGAGRAQAVGKSGLRIVEVSPGSERALLAKLAHNPHFKFVELDRRVSDNTASNDPLLGSQWHLNRVGAVSAWDVSQGTGVTIAILDSGIDTAHPDFAGRLVPGYNFVDGNTNVTDVRNHGTRTAGTAAATLNNGVGVASVAGRSTIMPLRISGSDGYATFSAMAQALTWAADRGARVANISFSGASSSAAVINAANYMRSKGGLVFVSAGNTGGDQGFAASDALIVVSATNSADDRTSWSSFGGYVDLAAPGEGVYTTDWNQGYASVNGTSYAAPVAAGVAALVMAANPALTPTQVEQILFSTAVDLGAAGKDVYFGHGRIDAAAAVQAALSSAAAPPPDTQAPAVGIAAPLASSTVSGLVAVDVNASDNVGVSRVELRVDGQLLATETVAPFKFSWDSGTVANGMHALEARAFDAAGNVGSSGSVLVNVANNVPVDTTPPAVAFTSPGNGQTVPAGNVDVRVAASDDQGDAGITQTLFINGKRVATATGGVLSYRWNTRPMKAGNYTLSAVARDAAGNERTVSITVRR